MDDSTILDMYFNRQESALEETRKKYGNRLYRISMNILKNNEDAEECVSDTLLKAWEVIPPNRPTMFGAFLAKVTRNLSLNKWEARSAAKRGGGETNLLLSELEDCIPSVPEYEANQITEAINAFLHTMDKPTRVIFVLRYFHGESIRTISERFRLTESKVKSTLFRTRKKLSTYLEKEGIIV